MTNLNAQEIELVQGGFALVGYGAYGSVNWNEDKVAQRERYLATQAFLALNPWATSGDVPGAGGSFN